MLVISRYITTIQPEVQRGSLDVSHYLKHLITKQIEGRND